MTTQTKIQQADEEQCPHCGKAISDEEYVVNWASCSTCFDKHVAAYFEGPTKGPWLAGQPDMFGDVNITGSGDARAIAAVISNMRDPAQIQANARLIAAAPELLETLQGCLPRNVCLTNTNVRDDLIIPLDVTMGDLRKIAAVISKATGAQS